MYVELTNLYNNFKIVIFVIVLLSYVFLDTFTLLIDCFVSSTFSFYALAIKRVGILDIIQQFYFFRSFDMIFLTLTIE